MAKTKIKLSFLWGNHEFSSKLSLIKSLYKDFLWKATAFAKIWTKLKRVQDCKKFTFSNHSATLLTNVIVIMVMINNYVTKGTDMIWTFIEGNVKISYNWQ